MLLIPLLNHKEMLMTGFIGDSLSTFLLISLRKMKFLVWLSVFLGICFCIEAQKPDLNLKKKGLSGNPVFEGWYADPEAAVYGKQYWIYPTLSDTYGTVKPIYENSLTPRQKLTINKNYLKQTYLDAFSSKDLVLWTKHSKVLDIKDFSWAEFAVWAPASIHTNGKYYLFFGANDIQNDQQLGGIGVGVSNNPEGPYKDALGKPLIDHFHNGAQPIDPCVFRDDDGQVYMYYGGWGHCNVAKLSADLLNVIPLADGTYFKEITPEKYVEGPFMIKRKGVYYFMWSEGSWEGSDYSVAYAMSGSPVGPFTRKGKILQQDSTVAKGPGHHSVIKIPGKDEWVIAYHRRPLGETNGNHRETCLEKLIFKTDGSIEPVTISFKGVFKHRLQ